MLISTSQAQMTSFQVSDKSDAPKWSDDTGSNRARNPTNQVSDNPTEVQCHGETVTCSLRERGVIRQIRHMGAIPPFLGDRMCNYRVQCQGSGSDCRIADFSDFSSSSGLNHPESLSGERQCTCRISLISHLALINTRRES